VADLIEQNPARGAGYLELCASVRHEASSGIGLSRSQHPGGRLRSGRADNRRRQLSAGEWAEMPAQSRSRAGSGRVHTQHPADVNAPGTLPLNSPMLQRIQAKWPDPRSFISQATPRQLATYGFVGEPAYSGAGTSGGHTRPTTRRTSSSSTATGPQTR